MNRKNVTIEKACENRPAVNLSDIEESDNLGALAGATEVKVENFWDWFDSNAKRQAGASRIIEAVLSCDPEDRVLFLETILDQIRPGWPRSFSIDLMHEAAEWAACSTRRECKAYLWACWQHLPQTDQMAFLGHVQGRAAA